MTRRSQVKILPPLLEKPRKRGFSVFAGEIGLENFYPVIARYATRRREIARSIGLARNRALNGVLAETLSSLDRRSWARRTLAWGVA